MDSMKIFNELSEHVALRIHSCNDVAHTSHWVESKLHKDYGCFTVLIAAIMERYGQGNYQGGLL